MMPSKKTEAKSRFMVYCACGKALDKVPAWLSNVNVEFVCTNCPKRQIKSISQLSMEQQAAAVAAAEPKMDDFAADDDDED